MRPRSRHTRAFVRLLNLLLVLSLLGQALPAPTPAYAAQPASSRDRWALPNLGVALSGFGSWLGDRLGIGPSGSSAVVAAALPPLSSPPPPPTSYDLLHHGAPSTPWTTQLGPGVHAVFGTFGWQELDLSVPGRGLDFAFLRTYSSANAT
jgi:hypothetical protein